MIAAAPLKHMTNGLLVERLFHVSTDEQRGPLQPTSAFDTCIQILQTISLVGRRL